MTLRLHDTMTGGPVEVSPLEPGHVRLYTCGPTVYARAHIGNFRAYTFEDVLRRVLEQRFPRVTHVMNLTDVEDKIIRNAITHHTSLEEETAPWINAFFEDVDAIGIRRAHRYPRATEYIDDMVALIQRLERRGVTYRSEGSVYYRISAFPEYGRLSGVRASGLVAGAGGRVDADEYEKEDARDFALWKAVDDGGPAWDTPLGRGRPGWHIECSAMSMKLLGESFDIHCGGVDNIFPHHENEIAQSEAATGQRFVRIWCHNQHLRLSGEKMAKSLGNMIGVRDVVESGVRPSTVRFLLAAGAHYRSALNYTDEAVRASEQAVDRLLTFHERLAALQAPRREGPDEAETLAARTVSAVDSALDDDLNVPGAVGSVFTALRDANRLLDAGGVTEAGRVALIGAVDRLDDVLGVLPLATSERDQPLADHDRELLDRRAAARSARDWAASDALRAELAERGIAVEDTPGGQRWHRAV